MTPRFPNLHTRWPRRALAATLASALAAGVTLASGLTSTAQAQGRDDVLVVGMATSDIISLDPGKAFEFSGVGALVQIYDRLMDFQPGKFDAPVPSLAKSYSVSDDGKTWTFKLRDDVKFHSGNPLTASDVVYSFQRVVALDEQPSFILTQFGITEDSVKAIDDHTVSITLDAEYAGGIFLACLGAGVASIVDSEVVKQHEQKTDKYPDGDRGMSWLSTNSAGSGPFVLRQWAKNERVVMDANPDHFANPPKIKRAIIKEINEATTRRLQVEKGDIDIAWRLLPDQANAMKGNSEVNLEQFPEFTIYYLAINAGKGPLADPRVREAIRYATDYDGLVNGIMGGSAKRIGTFIPEGFAGYTPELTHSTDLDKAKALLAEAGYADGFEVTLDYGDQTPNPELAQATQAALARVGITIRLSQLVSAQLWPKYRAQQHELLMARWGPDYMDPHTNAQPFADYTVKSVAWRNQYYNEETAAMIKKAGVEMDQDTRIGIYEDVNKIIQRDGPYVFLFQPLSYYGVRKNVHGFLPPPNFDLFRLYSISKG